MKKLLKILLISLFCITLTSCYIPPKNDITVYKTTSGEKYHEINCRYVKDKEIEIKLSKALYDGLEPCKVCKPETQIDLDKLN